MSFVTADMDIEQHEGSNDEPFLLNPRNRDFVQGEARYIANLRINWSLDGLLGSVANTLAIPGIILLIIFSLPSMHLFDIQTYVIFFVCSVCLAAAVWGLRLRNFVRLSRDGRVIPGAVMKATARHSKDGDYTVTVWYSFVSPVGNKVVGKNSMLRSDVRAEPHRGFRTLPEPGTSVAVIYVDDKHFRML
jgi:hypothetical protein